jgi:Tfp pilus assembly protein PilO
MIMEKLTKLDKPKRISAAVLTVLAAACVCYFVITKNSITKLNAANANYTGIEAAYTATENLQAELSNLQKQLEEKEKKFQEYQQHCFSSIQAAQFLENVNVMALAYNLKPISRIISEPIKLITKEEPEPNKLAGTKEESEPPQQFLKTQSAKIAVLGNYFDITDFMKELTNRPQKVCITNLRITLPAGDEANPKTSFEIILIIDPFKDIKK